MNKTSIRLDNIRLINKQQMEKEETTLRDKVNTLLEKVGLKAEEVKLAQMKLDDGVTVLEANEFVAGEAVSVLTEDEQMIALPVGEYILEDGMTLVVLEEGTIAEIKETVAEEEAPAEEEVAATVKPEATPALPKSIIESVSKETKFSAEEMTEVMNRVTELEAQIVELTKVEEEVVELAEVIKPNPEATTVKESKGFKWGSKSTMTPQQRVMHKIANFK